MSFVAHSCSPPRLLWRCVHSGCPARLLPVLSWLTLDSDERVCMETLSDAVFSSWDLNPWVIIPSALLGTIYARGWWQLHRRAPDRFAFPQLIAFFAGLVTVVVALL